jgi:hypothetical protein
LCGGVGKLPRVSFSGSWSRRRQVIAEVLLHPLGESSGGGGVGGGGWGGGGGGGEGGQSPSNAPMRHLLESELPMRGHGARRYSPRAKRPRRGATSAPLQPGKGPVACNRAAHALRHSQGCVCSMCSLFFLSTHALFSSLVRG